MLASHAAWKPFSGFFIYFFFKASAHRWNQQTNVLLMCFLIPLKFAGQSRQRFARAPNNLTSLVWVHLLNAFSECCSTLINVNECVQVPGKTPLPECTLRRFPFLFFFFFFPVLNLILDKKKKKKAQPVLGGHYTADSQCTSPFLTLIKSLRCRNDCIWSPWW